MNVLPGESRSSLLKNESAASSPGAGKIEAVRAYSVCDCSDARWIVAVAATYLAGSPRFLMTESIPASYSPAMVPSGPVIQMQLVLDDSVKAEACPLCQRRRANWHPDIRGDLSICADET